MKPSAQVVNDLVRKKVYSRKPEQVFNRPAQQLQAILTGMREKPISRESKETTEALNSAEKMDWFPVTVRQINSLH